MPYKHVDPNIKEAYLNWYVLPPGVREPSSKKAFAEEYGVSLRTLFNWEKDPEFKERQVKLRKEWGLALHSDIIGRLMEVVENGKDNDSIAAARVLLGHLDLGEVADKREKVDKTAIGEALKDLGFEVRDKA